MHRPKNRISLNNDRHDPFEVLIVIEVSAVADGLFGDKESSSKSSESSEGLFSSVNEKPSNSIFSQLNLSNLYLMTHCVGKFNFLF